MCATDDSQYVNFRGILEFIGSRLGLAFSEPPMKGKHRAYSIAIAFSSNVAT